MKGSAKSPLINGKTAAANRNPDSTPESRVGYFKGGAERQPLFLPEYEVSKEVVELIETNQETREEKLNKIVEAYNKIALVEHYDGSGWLDFQLMLGGYFRHYDYAATFNRDTGMMRAEKVQSPPLPMSTTTPHRASLSTPARVILVVGLFTYFLFKWASHHYGLGKQFAAAFSYIMVAAFIVAAFLLRDEFFKKIILFGLLAGITELLSDWYLVEITRTLVYPKDEPMLLASPRYMPASWVIMLVEVGYVGWMFRKHGLWVAMLISMLFGAVFIPAFEYFARQDGWWYYRHCAMWRGVPYYIVLSEALIALALPWMFERVQSGSYGRAAALGIAQGLWIWLTPRWR